MERDNKLLNRPRTVGVNMVSFLRAVIIINHVKETTGRNCKPEKKPWDSGGADLQRSWKEMFRGRTATHKGTLWRNYYLKSSVATSVFRSSLFKHDIRCNCSTETGNILERIRIRFVGIMLVLYQESRVALRYLVRNEMNFRY